ncbi:hypothetical protein MPSEU_000979900 [Mayamaea pseudoterrestris]|nr:hypothetical protein MPSEU_000979900 [Mayamaea pseudoterrestris]
MDDMFEMNQDNIFVGSSSSRKVLFPSAAAGHNSPRSTIKPLNFDTDYDDDCPLAPVLINDDPPPMSLPPQFALQILFQTLAEIKEEDMPFESRDDCLGGTKSRRSTILTKASVIAPLGAALDSLQGNERRFLLPLVHQKLYNLKCLATGGSSALQGQDLARLLALQEAAGPRWKVAIVRVKRVVSTESDDEDEFSRSSHGGMQQDEENDDGYAASRLFVDKLVHWTGKRPVDVCWFNLGLHSVEDGGIVLETEQQVECGDMWTERASTANGDMVYETYMLAFYDKQIKKNKFTWLKY